MKDKPEGVCAPDIIPAARRWQYRTIVKKASAGCFLAIALVILAVPVQANDRVKALEDKLNQTIKQMEMLTKELSAIKRSNAPVAKAGSGDIAKQLKQIRMRVDDVEDVVSNVEEKVGSRAVVHAFDALKLDLGGGPPYCSHPCGW